LIQQNLIYHCPGDKAEGGRTFYEANTDAAYALVRSGKVMDLVEEKFGPYEKDVMQNILLHGHVQVSNLEDQRDKGKTHTNGVNGEHSDTNGVNGVNGNHGKKTTSPAAFDGALSRLIESGYVEIVVERMFRSPTDAYDLLEKEFLRRDYGGQLKGPRGVKDSERQAQELETGCW
jgi:DNA-directed RNA polymerase III subunit RPC3